MYFINLSSQCNKKKFMRKFKLIFYEYDNNLLNQYFNY